MIDIISDFLSYDFLKKALIVGLLVTLSASLLGVSLVLKRFSMIGDGLSHVAFGAISIAAALNIAPLKVSIPVVVIAAFLLLKLSQNSKINGDAAIALISSSALAIGVFINSLSTNIKSDLTSYMFGSILAISDEDLIISVILSFIVITLFVIFYNKIFSVTFDESFAKATGIKSDFYNMLIAFLTAITTVIGMRLMGALLMSSLLIFPAITSMRLCRSFKSVVISSSLVSTLCFIVGLGLSYSIDTPAGSTIVIINLFMLILAFTAEKILKK
ncbi:MAG: metal ABC transporter permease [Ruminococcus sp.]|nr:metal ABC transporter permease [Ruminococcus sp.]